MRPKATGREGEKGKAAVTRKATGSDPPSRPQKSHGSPEKQLERRKRREKRWEKGNLGGFELLNECSAGGRRWVKPYLGPKGWGQPVAWLRMRGSASEWGWLGSKRRRF